MTEPAILLCARADAPLMTLGSNFDHVCSNCGYRVMVSASGKEQLRTRAQMTIVCMECYRIPDEPTKFEFSAGSVEATLRELGTRIPNPLKNKN